jgi:hypothetical protein
VKKHRKVGSRRCSAIEVGKVVPAAMRTMALTIRLARTGIPGKSSNKRKLGSIVVAKLLKNQANWVRLEMPASQWEFDEFGVHMLCSFLRVGHAEVCKRFVDPNLRELGFSQNGAPGVSLFR